MTTDDDVRIAVREPCPTLHPVTKKPLCVVINEVSTAVDDPSMPLRYYRCNGCDGNGAHFVVTDQTPAQAGWVRVADVLNILDRERRAVIPDATSWRAKVILRTVRSAVEAMTEPKETTDE